MHDPKITTEPAALRRASAEPNQGTSTSRTLGLSMVKNEQCIIEAFVRHNIRFFDHFVILDNGSIDETLAILEQLAVEFCNLILIKDDRFGYTQSEHMTRLLREHQAKLSADFVVPIDADEFLDAPDKESLQVELAAIPVGGYGLVPWATMVLTPELAEAAAVDPLLTMHWRRAEERPPYYKAILRLDGAPADDLVLEQGNHGVHTVSGRGMPVLRFESLRLLHYPVRSRDQIVAKSVVGWMAYLAANPQAGEGVLGNQWRANFHRVVAGKPIQADDLSRMSMLYTQDQRAIHWNEDVVREGLRLVYERRYSTGAPLGAAELIARSWELAVTSQRRHAASPKVARLISPLAAAGPVLVPPASKAALQTASAVEELVAQGRNTEAIGLLEKALGRSETAEGWCDWATLQYGAGRGDSAEQGYRRALFLDPNHRDTAVNLGLLLVARGAMAEGRMLLDRHGDSLSEAELKAIADLAAPFAGLDSEKPLAKPRRRFLVIVRADERSLHPSWLQGGGERNWDLLVHSFGDHCPWSAGEGVEIVQAVDDEIPGPKLHALHSLCTKRREQLLSYDYIALFDDDLAADVETINRLFLLAEHYGLELSQPALTHDSYMAAWGITMENRSFLLRYTTFVEMMAPVFSRAFFARCAPSFNENRSGYGLDLLWSSWVTSPSKMGILDACTVKHTRPSYKGKLYKMLAEMGSDPDQELMALIKKWRLVREEDQIPGRVVVPIARVLGGILRDQTRISLQEGHGMQLIQALVNGFPEEMARNRQQAIGFLFPVMQHLLAC